MLVARRTACIRQVRWLAELASSQALPSLSQFLLTCQFSLHHKAARPGRTGGELFTRPFFAAAFVVHACKLLMRAMTNPLVSSAPNLGHSCLVFYFQNDTTAQVCILTLTNMLLPCRDIHLGTAARARRKGQVPVVSNIKSNQPFYHM